MSPDLAPLTNSDMLYLIAIVLYCLAIALFGAGIVDAFSRAVPKDEPPEPLDMQDIW